MKRSRRFKVCMRMHDGSWMSMSHAPNTNLDEYLNGYTKRHRAEHAKRWYRKNYEHVTFEVFENLTPP